MVKARVADDILHARLQTLGVVEYASPDILTGRRYAWKLYDVSGVVSQPSFSENLTSLTRCLNTSSVVR